MGFLGVYKAIYDYVPQGDSELAITEGDILYVLEKSDEDDWWKAKKKASGEDDDEPTGLVPSNYVKEAQPTHQARALYDYTRQTDEELSFTEDATLEVFDTSDPDWILVGLDREYGFAPANYIEVQEETAQSTRSEAPPPSLPRRPPAAVEDDDSLGSPGSPQSPAHNPAAALAGIINQRKASAPVARGSPAQYTPEASDDDEGPPPSMPARPASQARAPEPVYAREASPTSPGPTMSPPYNRASFNRNSDDEVASHAPGGFHMYNINEMVHVMGKRKKMPTTLGINIATGVILIAPEKSRDGPEQTWAADKMSHYSIEGKHVFLELVRPSKSVDFHAGAKDTAMEIVSALGELAGAVRAEGLREVIFAGTGEGGQKKGQVLYDFMAQGDDEVTVAVGDEIIVINDTTSDEWWQVKRLKTGKEGVVPASYIEITGMISTPGSSALDQAKLTIEQNRLEEERRAKESLRAARMEEDSKGSQVIPERGSSLSARDISNQDGKQRNRSEGGRDGQTRASKSKPDVSKVRTWTDRSKSFSVEAQFLALKDGKINLHKMNGVKIAVPVVKMSIEDLEYVERMTGVSLDEDKPLSDIKKQQRARTANNTGGTGASIVPKSSKPEYDWFSFFLSCEVPVGLCERYGQAFNRDSMDESVLADIDATVLRTLGIREGDIIKIMRYLDKKYNRTGGKRNVSSGAEEDGEAGGLFSGPGGTLKNNTRKGRPAPAVQTNDIVDADAFKQGSNEKTIRPEGVATPLASMPTPAKKDQVRSGFDDDAWDVKPSKQQPEARQIPQSAPVSAPAPAQHTLTGSMQDLSLLSAPLEPTRVQPPNPAQPPQISQPLQQQAPPQPQGATPSFFAGIGQQQTGLPKQQMGAPFNPQLNQLNIARARPAPPSQFQSQGSLMIPAPPSRPLSAPQANQQSGFSLPPLQAQNTGFQNSSGFQNQIAPPGQSLNDIRMQQQYTGFNGPQNPTQNTGMMNQSQNFGQFNNGMQNSFQYPMQTGMQSGMPQQQNTMNNGGGPFADPRQQQFSPLQQQPTGFQSSFGPPQQQFPQPTGVNSFLPPPLQPQQTGMPQQQQQNGFSAFNPPPIPPMPQQNTISPLVPQKTGPPPPVRFGVTGDAKKVMPQATGRRANLSQATPQNPFGF
ncbi:related to Actin cytoskeleton-regulatory complex protein sla1 [Rhynchosporium secalis]|uniref:Actin cytoskeleton-regulatory complex protein SLA1 n=1 Tax=Rhynchosporium secalis TaxID=38038 RepID=A0A1E1MID7_RHYSE|nr:related to Actin cytoskeleton-regulatory complex protein sla1 [Rhynchosporium secalis]